MIANKTVLGIDISSRKIDMVWAGREGQYVKVLKSVSEPLPEGVVVDGNVENPSKLAKAISNLKKKHKIQAGKTAVSFTITPMLTQLMYMPKPIPTNPRKHFKKEVEKYAILPKNSTITLDFCRILPTTRTNENRLLVTAAEHKKVAKLIKALRKANIDIDLLEPSMLGCISSLYQSSIENDLKSKSLLMILREGLLFCIAFCNGGIDLINIKKPDSSQLSGNDFSEYLTSQISSIQNYYDIELMEESKDWQIAVVLDKNIEETENLKQKIQENIDYKKLDLIDEHIEISSIPCIKSDNDKEHLPPAAAGTAIKLLGFDRSRMKVNLLPPETTNLREAKKQAIITANLAAVVILLIFLFVGILNTTIQNINAKTNTRSYRNTTKLIEEQNQLDQQLSSIAKLVEDGRAVFEKHKSINWAVILNDIENNIPSDVRITSIITRETQQMTITGMTLSNESIGKFADALSTSEYIDLAALTQTQKHKKNEKILRYTLNCKLKQKD
jgi:Tfp pilus assembly PilM family ATPase/Tfp pilus assembly protein PilN